MTRSQETLFIKSNLETHDTTEAMCTSLNLFHVQFVPCTLAGKVETLTHTRTHRVSLLTNATLA
jgi:hypothetical protein